MRYTVCVEDAPFAAIGHAACYIAIEQKSPENARRWLDELWERIDDLETLPRRHPIDAFQTAVLGRPTHKLVFGPYVVFFQVDDEQELVNVLGFRHGATRGET